MAVDTGLGLGWGLGWGIEQIESGRLIWHWGNNPGYRAFEIASVQTGNGFVMMTNSDNGLALAQPITAQLLPGTHKLFQFYMLHDGSVSFACKVFNQLS